MHGVKRTPAGEVDEAKEAAKAAKAQKLNALCMTVLQRKREGLYDKESLALCVKALEANPEFYTAWNFRREILGRTIAGARQEFPEPGAGLQAAVSAALAGELALLEGAIGMNPKAYCLWMHREWVVDQMVAAGVPGVLDTELALCEKLLQADERNFHCWGYRVAVARKAGRGPDAELAYTSDRIDRNFSNYSAWHYRARFLHAAGGARLADERGLVERAAFTDPADQSAWIYNRWVLARAAPHALDVTAGLPAGATGGGAGVVGGGSVLLTFSEPVRGVRAGVRVEADGTAVAGRWEGAPCGDDEAEAEAGESGDGSGGVRRAWVWAADACPGAGAVLRVAAAGGALRTAGGAALGALALELGGARGARAGVRVLAGAGAEEGSAGEWAGELAAQEAMCAELLSVEPDCKWALLTSAALAPLRARLAGAPGGAAEAAAEEAAAAAVRRAAAALARVDAARSVYYADLASAAALRAAVTRALAAGAPHADPAGEVRLEGLSLTALDAGALARLAGARGLSLARNALRSADGLPALPGLARLDLSHNPALASLRALAPLARAGLRELALCGCGPRAHTALLAPPLLAALAAGGVQALELDRAALKPDARAALAAALPSCELRWGEGE